MRQYLGAKAAHPDALLFFRMGDFYELFFEDAVVAARALELTLTARNKGSDDEVPMAGVPHHAVSSYIQRLLEQGFKVAICEQMADPKTVKGIVPREVVRVVTPGIVFDESGLAARENHYLVAVERDETAFGVAALDMSTGELLACEAADLASALAEVVRLDPREALIAPEAADLAAALQVARSRMIVRTEQTPMSLAHATEVLDALLGEGEATAACASASARRAAARCVAVARACEAGRPLPIARISAYALGETLLLDESTQAHLELVRSMGGDAKGSLLAQIDATRTSAGARLLRRRLLAPRTNVAEIRRRHDAVEIFVTQPGLRAEVCARLGSVSDLERLAVKLAFDRAGPRDLLALRRSLAEIPALVAALASCPDPSAKAALCHDPNAPWIDVCGDLHEMLASALSEDAPARASERGVIRDGFDAELDEARMLMRDGQRVMVELEVRLREAAKIPSLKLRYTRVFGWYMEVTRSHLEKAPKEWRRKQTVATGERFTCEELDQLADKLAHAEERASSRESELFAKTVREMAGHAERLRRVSSRLAEWDVAAALAEVAHRDDFARPDVDDSFELAIEDGRHPVVEKLAAAGRFVPNDVVLSADPREGSAEHAKRLWLVTGPNMAGKSTLMRQVALIVILAQMGSFVPARRARIGVVDRVLTRVGASDNVSRGESTFMVEMKETANVLRRATRRSLVVLDEIGRGTSTYDGLAIAWAVAEHLHDVIGCRAMFATHYHELTELAGTHPGCENWSVSAREHEGDIVFLHRLQRGPASRSYGVACARLAGLPELVLVRARILLEGLERGRQDDGAASASPESASAPPAFERSGAPLRGHGVRARPQLDLFAAPAEADKPHPALEILRVLDVDRLSPLEALTLVARLRKMTSSS